MHILTRSLMLLSVLPLAGCLQDAASYSFPEKDHAITLIRNQTWFWQDTLDVDVSIQSLPDCNGGTTIKNVPVDTRIALYQAPNEYPEPLYLLKTGNRVFAVSTQSCRVQEFKEAPPDLGMKLGSYTVKDGVFRFVPADPFGKPEKE